MGLVFCDFAMKLYVVVVLISLFNVLETKNAVEEVYYWRNVNYEHLPLDDNTYIGKYKYHIPVNNDIIGLSYHASSGLMLAAVSRLRAGVPSTLNAFCVSDYPFGTSPHLWGFPNFEKNTLKASFYGETDNGSRMLARTDTKHTAYYNYLLYGGYRKSTQRPYNFLDDFSIISVYHPQVDDRCNRLFFVDTGYLQYDTTTMYEVQLPAIVVFSLPGDGCQTRQFPLVRRVEIPQYLWKNQAGFNFVTLDYQKKGSCDDLVLYISQAFDSTVIAYDYKRGNFWTIAHDSMKPVMSESFMVFSKDHDYQLPLGVVNVAVGWPDKEGNKLAYFTPGSSQAQYAVSTKYWKNPKRSVTLKHSSADYPLLGYRGCNSQQYKQVFDESTGVMFFAEMQSNRVRCWNTRLPINPDNMGVVLESDALEFVSDMFVDSEGYLWFHSSQVPIDFLTSIPLDLSNVNSRSFRVKVSEGIKGTVCQP